MAKYTSEELNGIAMQMILNAGNGRDKINKALCALEEDFDFEQYDMFMKEAHNDITKAHQFQTQVVQSTIEDENVETTFLFTHAQDTLMTINTEMNLAKHLGKMFKVIAERMNA